MWKVQAILTAFLASSAMGSAALTQSATQIINRDVVGDWQLLITPAERQDLNITFKSRDGGQQLDFPLTIAAQANGRLTCVVSGNPAECRIRNGGLVVVSAGGGVRMTFTLSDRTRGAFSGTVSMRLRMLPIGGHVGSVRMTRR